MRSTEVLYQQYRTHMTTLADVRSASAVLQWDQETYLPSGAGERRGAQISTLSELAHKLFTATELGDVMQELSQRNDLTAVQRTNVQRSLHDYKKAQRYPSTFVRKLSEAVNKAFHSWIGARKENSFKVYATALNTLIGLKKEEAALLGGGAHPYDALLDEYEKGCTVALLDKTFGNLLPGLSKLLAQIKEAPQVDDSFLHHHFPKDQQWAWGMELIKGLGFDFSKGRQDVSEHPFSTSFGATDVRITTRIDENDFGNMNWSCIHEVGHALYEQGLPDDQYGLPGGEAASYSIHESQSRLWENNVGRSLSFWTHWYPVLQQHFPQQLGGVDVNRFYKGINKVQPSLIRTEADEVTYHFHVAIRYNLEKELIAGNLSADDIVPYWNNQYKNLLGVTVPDDKRGALQDVHWSHGSFGYFPTYSLGSLYAAQFFASAQKALPQLNENLRTGDTSALLGWLRNQVHSKGKALESEQLCKEITGAGLDVPYFSEYLFEKYRLVYTL